MNAKTGVQLYLKNILPHFKVPYSLICPKKKQWNAGFKGHLWEQAALPWKLKGELLWSPCNTGPVSYKNQIVTIHDICPVDHPEWYTPQFSTWYRILLEELCQNSRKIITVSKFSKRRIVQNFGTINSKIQVIYNGVREFQGSPTPLSKLGIKKDFILSLCTKEPRKNLEMLARVWKPIWEKYDRKIDLVLAGNKGLPRVFSKQNLDIENCGIINLHSLNDGDLVSLYGHAKCFVYPSKYEGFGMPPLEAMSFGTPVVLSDIEVFREVFKNEALYFDLNDEKSLEFSIDQAISTPKKTFKILDNYKWNKTARQTEEVLQSLL